MFSNLKPYRPQEMFSRPRTLANSLQEMQQNMDEMMNSFFREGPLPSAENGNQIGTFIPSVDVSEDRNAIHVSCNLPGVKEDDIDLSVENNVLQLRAQTAREEKEEDKDRNYFMRERFEGSFQRNIPLSSDIREDQVRAELKDGVLTVELPKAAQEENKARKISVKRG